ncbi:aa3-type cytochrome c oxidase subunit IV [Alphaproteobacteria bacterium]|nr:aa3-type cytochrome c oxidase subunit IV [Alphaproteobacteria bacterium]
MSYNEKKYLEDHKKTWRGFVNLSIKGSIVITIILILMSIFLTG